MVMQDSQRHNVRTRMRRGGHTMRPQISIPSRVAWALAFEADRRRLTVADLLAAISTTWANAWYEQLGETDRKRFEESVRRLT